jgi:hypothetical protein
MVSLVETVSHYMSTMSNNNYTRSPFSFCSCSSVQHMIIYALHAEKISLNLRQIKKCCEKWYCFVLHSTNWTILLYLHQIGTETMQVADLYRFYFENSYHKVWHIYCAVGNQTTVHYRWINMVLFLWGMSMKRVSGFITRLLFLI